MHDRAFKSASKFTLTDLLTLRFGLDPNLVKDAEDRLSGYGSWGEYRKSFQKGKEQREGNFFLAKLFQDQAAELVTDEISWSVSPKKTRSMTKTPNLEGRYDEPQTPVKSSGLITGEAVFNTIGESLYQLEEGPGSRVPLSTPSTKGSVLSAEYTTDDLLLTKTVNEQIVNTALVNFLKAITEHFPDISQRWTIHPWAFHATAKGTKLYEARTDGFLSDRYNRHIYSIIEVKAAQRSQKMFDIFMQESAQVVAWILSQPNESLKLRGRCFQVLQDRHEIYINFAEFGEKYLHYERGQEVDLDDNDPESFMNISQIGPYSTTEVDDMERFVPILLALTLRAGMDKGSLNPRETIKSELTRKFEQMDLGSK
ncbi:hypothetical protein PHISCL_03332 [Aspergillus sclerotialis]|uniref:Uncharacterized protein n=1 Tax=Aspergillus sclerotialis TaxID=2070753 RepID=A0A3A2ZSG8_9EURO|nr:hypothetical protein PHISCL_03332 [Aspergillus sclerotialis]